MAQPQPDKANRCTWPGSRSRPGKGPSSLRAHRTPSLWLAGATLAAVLVLSGAVPLPVAGSHPLLSPCPAAAEPGQVRVALVVDFGTVPGSPGRVDQRCVTVKERSNGFDVLQAAGYPIRVSPQSGLLCAIDGYPAPPACGDRTSQGYEYWAYFSGGDSGWVYSSVGPGSRYVREGSVEGWRFVHGQGNPNDPAPRAAASATAICPPPPPAPPSTSASSTAPAPTANGGANGGGTGGAVGGNAPGVASTPAPADGGAAPTSGGATTDPEAAGGSGEQPDQADGAHSASSSPIAGSEDPTADGGEAAVVELHAQTGSSGPGGTGPLAAVGGVTLIAALGGVAAWRLRRGAGAPDL